MSVRDCSQVKRTCDDCLRPGISKPLPAWGTRSQTIQSPKRLMGQGRGVGVRVELQ